MASAADIISYIGIPLAVVGVLPIIYTSVNGLVTVSNIKQGLRRNGLEASTRGSYIAGIIEVELPRWTITPLDRDEAKYWTLNPNCSDLPGGTWTVFNWNQIITGRKLYRLQYSGDLREPQAEVDLEELIAFLLDRGAVPDAKGIHMLRLAGLFTPVGTSLLLSPDGKYSVLRIALSDDSDGVLSVALHWGPAFDVRDEDSLPPSWMRVEHRLSEAEAKATDVSSQLPEDPVADSTPATENYRSIRFHLGVSGGALRINNPAWETPAYASSNPLSAKHLQEAWAGSWFPAVATALGQLRGLALWTCHIPDQLATLAQRDILPCGVTVMAQVLNEDDAPAWETKYDPNEDGKAAHHRFMISSSRANAERSLPPAHAEAARKLRQAEEFQAFADQHRERIERDRQRRDQRCQEALISPRLDTVTIARSALKYLQREHNFDGCHDVQEASERILHSGIRDVEVAEAICKFLNRFQQAQERGGMNINDLAACENDPTNFCLAIVMMACLKLAGNRETSSLALDLQECVRVWKRVRVG